MKPGQSFAYFCKVSVVKETLATPASSEDEPHGDTPADPFRAATKMVEPGNNRRRHHDGC